MFTPRFFDISEIDKGRRTATYDESVITFLSDYGMSTDLNGTAPFCINAYSYLLIVDGEADLHINNELHRLKRGCLIIQTPLHNTVICNTTDTFRFSVVVISKSFLNNLPLIETHRLSTTALTTYYNPVIELNHTDCSIINDCIIDLTGDIKRDDHRYRKEIIQNAVIRFYLELHNACDKVSTGTETEHLRHNAILCDFIELLALHFKQQHNVWFYAQELNITPHYLTKIIKACTGKTPANIIAELLYNEARYLLANTSLSVQEIASNLNFSDQSSFGKFFKRFDNTSPLDYRKRNN